MSDTGVASGTRVSHYRVLHPLGAGGMGEVYAGEDETLRRGVAMKAIKPDHRLDPDAKARFLREARILSQLDHPNVCRVYDYIEGDDRDWLVMELVDGRTLQTILRAGTPVPDGIRIAEQIAAVLVATHAAGVVHRDLKPGNVMLTATGDVKVLDFGLAASVSAGAAPGPQPEAVNGDPQLAADPEVTRLPDPGHAGHWSGASLFQSTAGTVMGTVHYMSPEQASGSTATTASDMYSFGLLLQEVFTGQPAHLKAETYLEGLAHAQKGETRAIDGVAPALKALIERLKAVAPAQRPTAVEALERLRWIRDTPRRRLRYLAAAAVLTFAVGGAIKYTVDLSRERTAAVLARQEADQRRGQAEDLIGFMIGDLRGKLQQAGRLDLLEGVGQEAMEYFAAVPPEALTGAERLRRSQALHQIGRIRQAQGNLPSAIEAYRESVQVASDLAATDPANTDWQLGLSEAHFYLADALRRQGDLAGALAGFEAYRDIAQGLVDREPASEKFLLELSYGRSNVAGIHEAQGDLVAAKRELEAALALKQDLATRQPGDIERQQAVATGHNRLGVVLDKLGEAEEAIDHFERDLDMRRQIVARQPDDRSIKRGLLVAYSYLGIAHEDRGQLDDALAAFRRQREIAAAQAALDPQNADWQRDLGHSEYRVAYVQWLQGEATAAETGFVRAIAILGPVARLKVTDVAYQRDLADALLGRGLVWLGRGDPGAGLQQAEEVGRLLEPMVRFAGAAETWRLMAEARLLAGDAHAAMGEPAEARRQREAALRLLPGATSPQADKPTMATWVRTLLALNLTEQARPAIDRLAASGYRHPMLTRAIARHTPGAGSLEVGVVE